MNSMSRRDVNKILLAGCTGLVLGGPPAFSQNPAPTVLGSQSAGNKQRSGKHTSRATTQQGISSAAPKVDTGQAPWSDVVVVEQPEPIISYRTGWVVYEESLTKTAFVGRGWNGAGFINFYGDRLNPDEYAAPQAFQLQVDGQLLATDWSWAGINKTPSSDGNMQATVTLRHSVRPISLKIHTKLDGGPIITRWLDVTNTGQQPAAIAVARPWSGVLRKTERWRSHLEGTGLPLYSIGYFAGTSWGEEGNFQWYDLPEAGYRIDGRYRRGRYRQPMFMLRNNASGEFFIGQLAWTGGYSFDFDLDPEMGKSGASDASAALTFSAGMDAPAPLRMVASGETVSLPEMRLGLLFGGFDDAVQAMHTHLRRSVFLPKARGQVAWVESGIGPELEITPEQVEHAIDVAAQGGAEVFFIDASWYAPPGENWWQTVGDWNVDRNRFPQGLKPFRDRVHAAHMLWGLWMDAERVGENSQVARQHPDWLAENYNGARKMGGQLDLTKPAAAKWMEDQISRVIQENELDFFRLDYNTDQGRGIKIARDGFLENGYWRYYDTVYAIYGRLRKRFPNVIFENCAGGGGRTDIGMVRQFDHTDVTDWQIAPRSFLITNGMTMALPPEYVDRLLGGQDGQTAAEFDFQSRLLLFMLPKFGFLYPIGAAPNPLFMHKVKHWVDLYKEFVRPYLANSRIYHHTPVVSGFDPHGWGVLELASEDRKRDICGLFQLSAPTQPEYDLRLRGLDTSRRYRITLDNSGQTSVGDGFSLATRGITVRLEDALTSELLILEAVET